MADSPKETSRLIIARALELPELKEKIIEASRIKTAPGSEISRRWISVVNTASLDGETPVVVKTIRPYRAPTHSTSMAVDIVREIYIWQGLSHPNILPFIGFNLTLSADETIDSACLVSPFMSNGSLSEYLSRVSPDPARRRELAIDTAEGLNYLHNHVPPICHGDIHPVGVVDYLRGRYTQPHFKANVVISTDHRALICDFSVAKPIGENDMDKSIISSVLENPRAIRYMSPELVAGDPPEATLESDMWAWGCLALVHRATARQVLDSLTAMRNPAQEEDRAEPSPAALKAQLNKTLKALAKYHIQIEKISCDDRPFATGGFGSVYRAVLEEASDRKHVAVKKLEFPSDKEPLHIKISLARELRVWERLTHPNILPLVGFVLDDDNCWLISPYMPEGNIQHYLDTKKPLYSQRLALALDTAEGLEYLHRDEPEKSPICHGDIKLSNVLVTFIEGRPRALLCDFGLARVMDTRSGLTTAGFHTSGTQLYFSPELVLEDEPYRTLESDMWAWGCLLYQILTSKPIYPAARTNPQAILRISRGEPPATLTSTLPRAVKTLLEGCWNQEPSQRPTAEVAVQAIKLPGPRR
ncbi:hypothetical protein FRB99_006089 [Tulasnella sp. 403]|nr:hypothetical protein FRB99_006089 [Tulasnella sp. 403]